MRTTCLVSALSATLWAANAIAAVRLFIDFDHDHDVNTINDFVIAEYDTLVISVDVDEGTTLDVLDPDPDTDDCYYDWDEFGPFDGVRVIDGPFCVDSLVVSCELWQSTARGHRWGLYFAFRKGAAFPPGARTRIAGLVVGPASPDADCSGGLARRLRLVSYDQPAESNEVFIQHPLLPIHERSWARLKASFR